MGVVHPMSTEYSCHNVVRTTEYSWVGTSKCCHCMMVSKLFFLAGMFCLDSITRQLNEWSGERLCCLDEKKGKVCNARKNRWNGTKLVMIT